jgi:hypothetical protein
VAAGDLVAVDVLPGTRFSQEGNTKAAFSLR